MKSSHVLSFGIQLLPLDGIDHNSTELVNWVFIAEQKNVKKKRSK